MKQLTLWLGRAGSLKSRTIASEIGQEVAKRPIGSKIFWIVPETASFSAEQLLMERAQTTIRAEVVTLSRFAQRLGREARLESAPAITRTGQRLLLGHVLKQSSSMLELLHRARPTLGFLDSILDTFDEMSAHLVSMDGLQAALEIAAAQVEVNSAPAAHAGRRLLGKLHDLCALYFLYQREMQARGLADASQRMVQLLPHLSSLPSLRGSFIYLDGFDSLRPREFEFFMELCSVADRVVASVSADASWFESKRSSKVSGFPGIFRERVWNQSLTSLLEDTPYSDAIYGPNQLRFVRALMEACDEREWQCDTRHFNDGSHPVKPELAHLEAQVMASVHTPFQPDDAAHAHPEPSDAVCVFAAQNIRAETNGVAQDILSRATRGVSRFRDMMVVVPDMDTYLPYLKESFKRHSVPVDNSDAPSLALHPLGKFLMAVMGVVEEQLSTASVIRLLKTEFTTLTKDDADWLEEYLNRHGVSGFSDWNTVWEFSTAQSARGREDKTAVREDARANRMREALAPICTNFFQSLWHAEVTPLLFAEVIWKLLTDVRVKRTVASWVVGESSEKSPHEASLHEQAWQRTISILGDLAETMPDKPLARAFLFQSLREDLRAQTLATVPAGLDSVLVLDIERAASVHRKTVYVMGAVDGALPRRIRSTGLLQDDEREQFERLFGTRIGETAEERQLAERFRVYTALTRAYEALVITYPLANANGKEQQPSSVVATVRELFPDTLTVGWWPEGAADEDTVWTNRTALLHVVGTLRDVFMGSAAPPRTAQLFQTLSKAGESRALLSRAIRGITHKASAVPLPAELSRQLYGAPMRVNVYQLETAASCAYRHFLQYGLRIDDAQSADLTAAQRGTLMHAALAEFVLRQQQDPEVWRLYSDEESQTLMSAIFAELLGQPVNQVWTKTATRRAQAMEAESALRRAAIVLTRHLKRSRFVPYKLEFSFGTGEEDAAPAYGFELSDGTPVELRGRVDRVDVAEAADEHRFRIVDYKSRVMDIDLAKVFHGLRLQLPVYSAVVKSHAAHIWGRSSTAAGFFYLPLVRKMETRNVPMADTEALEKAVSRMKVKGLWRGDDLSVPWMDGELVSTGDSELFPKMYKKDGTFAKTAPVLSSEEWDAMERAVISRVQESTEQIHSGDISIQPYALSRQETACSTCSFAAVCQLDLRFDPSPLRWLQKKSKEEVLTTWMEKEEMA